MDNDIFKELSENLSAKWKEQEKQELPREACFLDSAIKQLPTTDTLGSDWQHISTEKIDEQTMRRLQIARVTSKFEHSSYILDDSPLKLEVSVYPFDHPTPPINCLSTVWGDLEHAKITGNWIDAFHFAPWEGCIAELDRSNFQLARVHFISRWSVWIFHTRVDLCLHEARKHYEHLEGLNTELYMFD
jgi:hypothetical protein